MDDLDLWRLCNDLSVVQAALLIAGVSPSLWQERVTGLPPKERPTGYDAAMAALTGQITARRLPAQIRRLAVPEEYVICPNYRIRLNRGHNPNVRFATLVHELAHLYLGHLGADKYLHVPNRSFLDPGMQEVEAESISYIVCHRTSVTSEAERYLSNYLDEKSNIGCLDVYNMMRAAGQIETVLGIAAHARI